MSNITIFLGIIGFIWCLLFITYFNWYSNNYVYTYTTPWNSDKQHKIQIPRFWYLLYGILMFVPICNLMIGFVCTIFYIMATTDGWTKYHYIGKNKFILGYINFKLKVKDYLTMKV